jgi:putative hemolysin
MMKKTVLAMLFLAVVGTVCLAAQDGQDSAAWGAQAAKYCEKHGGEVVLRKPYYGTNNVTPLQLAGWRYFCQFTSKADGSRIHILISTLYTEQPTLAASAYLFKPPFISTGCNGNPASCYCTQLGGSDFGLIQGGGAWETSDPNNVDQQLEACIFPDMSSIDAWGLTYHQANIIRGRDLTNILRFKPVANAASPWAKK